MIAQSPTMHQCTLKKLVALECFSVSYGCECGLWKAVHCLRLDREAFYYADHCSSPVANYESAYTCK